MNESDADPDILLHFAVNQKLTIKYLTELGYKCDVADNGKECLELLKKQPEQDYEYVHCSIRSYRYTVAV
jgi:CheY-like chemotaxis protein